MLSSAHYLPPGFPSPRKGGDSLSHDSNAAQIFVHLPFILDLPHPHPPSLLEPDQIPPSFPTQLRAASSLKTSLTPQTWDPLFSSQFTDPLGGWTANLVPGYSLPCNLIHPLFSPICCVQSLPSSPFPLPTPTFTTLSVPSWGQSGILFLLFVPLWCFLIKRCCTWGKEYDVSGAWMKGQEVRRRPRLEL